MLKLTHEKGISPNQLSWTTPTTDDIHHFQIPTLRFASIGFEKPSTVGNMTKTTTVMAGPSYTSDKY